MVHMRNGCISIRKNTVQRRLDMTRKTSYLHTRGSQRAATSIIAIYPCRPVVLRKTISTTDDTSKSQAGQLDAPPEAVDHSHSTQHTSQTLADATDGFYSRTFKATRSAWRTRQHHQFRTHTQRRPNRHGQAVSLETTNRVQQRCYKYNKRKKKTEAYSRTVVRWSHGMILNKNKGAKYKKDMLQCGLEVAKEAVGDKNLGCAVLFFS